MEVDLIAETAATSTAPEISELPPAARLGEEYSDEIYTPDPVPTPPVPEPIAQPEPAPAPKQATRPTPAPPKKKQPAAERSEEHTSELQSLMRISYAVFCLKKTKI